VSNPIIIFDKVDMAFGPKVVLNQVSFSVAKGETLAVIGPSGTGKSTVLKLLIGLLKPDAGRIIIDGHDVTEFNEDQWNELRKNMGMVFQYSALFDFLDIEDNIAFGLRQHTNKSEDEIHDIVERILSSVGLEGTEHSYPAELSGGMKKRVSLGRAIALNPGILLYDEPTAGLDPIMSNNISNLIVQTKNNLGVTSILVTHDMVSAFKASDKVAMLNEGRIVAYGTVAEMKNSTNKLVKAFMYGEQFLEAQKKGRKTSD
jgi:phospholipid/cholesterol/gamma-HCH transport system ATP-binding protein